MGNVYLICDAEKELFKIGVTKGDVEKRLKELQTGNGGELHIVHVQETDKPFKMETMLHNRFYPKNKKGEWFELSPEEVIGFQKYCELCQRNIDALKDNPFFN
ncbi:MAG: GIY-YIG nuclease family protein [Bacteroidales bacterium]|nr:GIY-YIG nuclease family protein [Bacteroidales bacterium]